MNAEELRTDRKHRLDLEVRYYPGSTSSDAALWLRAGWQRRFPLGWHELLWEARGTLLLGQVLFPDEQSVGDSLNGAFGGDFVHRVLGTKAEFRYSLLRDVFKVGVFYAQAFYQAIDHTLGTSAPRTAGAGGPALHVLLADEFQIDVYLAVGWDSTGATALAPALVLRQVF
jgi:hypothetical protein